MGICRRKGGVGMTRYHCDGCGKEWIEGCDSYRIEIKDCSKCSYKRKRQKDADLEEK